MQNGQEKKILIFSTAYYPFVGGAEVSVKEITDRLRGDFKFDLITAKMQKDLPDSEEFGNVVIYRVGLGYGLLDKLLLPFLGAVKARKLHRKNNYRAFWGIMVSFGSGAGYVFNILRFLTGRKKVPIILTLQEGDSEEHLKNRWFGLLNLSWKMSLKRTNFLTALSVFLLKRAESVGYKGSSAIIPNGVDIEVFSSQISDAEKKEMEEILGKRTGDIFLVTSSRLVRKNAVDDIISSLTYLSENISLVVMGKGEEGSKLQMLAEKFKVDHRVKFLGFVPQTDMPKFFSVCDIFIRPSRSEGFGNSFLEAMMAKLPVIATPVGGIPDFLLDKETGVFCAPDDPKSISVAVNTILGNPELRQNIIEKAYQMAVSKFNWDIISKRMKMEVFDKFGN